MTNLTSSSLITKPAVWSKHSMTQLTDSMSTDKEAAQDLVLKNNNNNNNKSDSDNIKEDTKEKEISDIAMPPAQHHKKLRREIPNGLQRDDVRKSSDAYEELKPDRISPTPSGENNQKHIPTSTSSRATPSPSNSPASENSPAPHRTRTPSFPGIPPHPSFTPPGGMPPGFERFNPSVAMGGMGPLAGGPAALKQMESLMNRNCSDLMRSLAAKYNNNNPNEIFRNPSNGNLRHPGLDTFKPRGPSPFLGLPPSTSITPHPPVMDQNQIKKNEAPTAPTAVSLAGLHPHPGAPSHMLQAVPGMLPGFPGFPMVDVSSTQVLMNLVRNASASASQQAQLDNYLRGASKRPSDGPTTPLDLSASMPNKRLCTEPPKPFGVKNFLATPHDGERRQDMNKSQSITSPSNNKTTLTARKNTATLCSDKSCPSLEAIAHWTVEDVISFVRSIDLCAEYSEAFRENKIDGSSLPLLTEEHLISSMNMKLGPAIKLRSVLARKLGACKVCLHCTHCHIQPEDRNSTTT